MCGRYVPPDEASLTRFWQVDRRSWPGWINPPFNIAPTMQVPIIFQAAEKPLWRHSLDVQRCLMPALGWYEWNEHEQTRNERNRKVNQPYFIHAQDSDVVAIAGLWSSWIAPDSSHVMSCALLTRAAAPPISAIHHRMPVVLKPDYYAQWMSAQASDQDVQNMIAGARQDLEGHAVSVKVNSVKNDDPSLIEPLRRDDLFG